MKLGAPSLLLLIAIGLVIEMSAWQPTATSGSAASTTCHVTLPNGSQPPVPNFGGTVTYSPGYKGPRDGRAKNSYGNGKLWTILQPDGTVVFRPGDTGTDGSLSTKWPWYRVRGKLRIYGRRLDGASPPLRASTSGSYDNNSGFQATSLTFPTEGCWKVTGEAGGSKLTFITRVVTSQ